MNKKNIKEIDIIKPSKKYYKTQKKYYKTYNFIKLQTEYNI